MKTLKHLGAYGLLIEGSKILLIKKATGPYSGKLDLPGGTIEFKETPEHALIREFNEEVGIDVTSYNFFNTDIANVEFEYKGELQKMQHIGFFYKIISYTGNIHENIELSEINTDSLGAKFYDINSLQKENLSAIALMQLEKLGYCNFNNKIK